MPHALRSAVLAKAIAPTPAAPSFPYLLSSTWVDNGASGINGWSPLNGADLSNCTLVVVAVAWHVSSRFNVLTGSAGWTKLVNSIGQVSGFTTPDTCLTVFTKAAPTNSETLTLSLASAGGTEVGGAAILRFTGGDSVGGAAVATIAGTSANPDPPNYDPGAVRNHLYLAIAAAHQQGFTAGPSGYSGFTSQASQLQGSVYIPSLGYATKTANQQAEDPGTFTLAAADYRATSTLALWHS